LSEKIGKTAMKLTGTMEKKKREPYEFCMEAINPEMLVANTSTCMKPIFKIQNPFYRSGKKYLTNATGNTEMQNFKTPACMILLRIVLFDLRDYSL
jgi:hypothetical protein